MSRPSTRILWLDDDKQRLARLQKQVAPALKSLGFSFETMEFGADFSDIDGALTKIHNANPTLLVIDHFLDNRACATLPRTGAAWSLMLREKYPQIALVGVSAIGTGDFTTLQEIQYIERFALDHLLDKTRLHELGAIATGYRKVWQSFKRQAPNPSGIMRWLKAPRSQHDTLSACLPGDFLAPWDNTTPHLFARWVWHRLLGSSGFTYDNLETATIAGLSVAGLAFIEDKLRPAKYAGVFASETRPRWWASEVSAVLYANSDPDSTDSTAMIGRRLARCRGARAERHFSRNYRTHALDPPPDCVAFADESLSAQRVVVDRASTKTFELARPGLGFDNPRFLIHT